MTKAKITAKHKILTLVLAAFVMVSLPAPAFADIMILPIRTVFKDRDRSRSITVINTSDKPALFRLSLYNMQQVETGGYKQLDAPLNPDYDLTKMLVFSPRQVQLPPGGKQAVRLFLRGGSSLPDGEYRVHLKMSRVSAQQPTAEKKEGVTVQLAINVGFSVPIIVRKGKYDGAASVSEAKLLPSDDAQKPPKLQLHINRTGKFSTLGRLEAFWTPPNGGGERQVGILNDVNVYAESPRRIVSIPLKDPSVAGGKVRIVYEGDDADKGVLFDEKVFALQ
ncbi:MAG: fimbria/pilus periplasmic chaperone [Alphaproteobacteria bacterium]|nr:fimbria/pilus periplasmic chaperone [Alphaproteobacteria bacterium]